MPTIKIEPHWVDNGCGFPIVLLDVPLVLVRDVWTPQVDYQELYRNVILALIQKPSLLTVQEITFVRHYFFMEKYEWKLRVEDNQSYGLSLENAIRMVIFWRLPDDVNEIYRHLKSEIEISEWSDETRFLHLKMERSSRVISWSWETEFQYWMRRALAAEEKIRNGE